MLRTFDILGADPTPVVEMYFRQCSIQADCRDLGIMAATLANRGINPVTGQQALRGEYVESVLSVMGSCGMYDYAGSWIYDIGIPSKSGVAGGIIAVLPGQLGIGVFSPPLDARGNSVRGIRVCDALSRHWDPHLFNPPTMGKSAIRLQVTGADVSSKRERSPEERALLREHGSRIRLCELQGNLTFAASEIVVHDIVGKLPSLQCLILDFKRVLALNESACHLFWRLLVYCSDSYRNVLFTGTQALPGLKRYMKAKLGARFEDLFKVFEDADLALEWCEQRLLEELLPGRASDAEVPPKQYQLLAQFTPEELGAIVPLLQRRHFKPSETIIHIGGEPNEMFFLARGQVSVMVPHPAGNPKRLATFSAGMTFGEMAVLDRVRRSATVVADSEVVCDVLTLENFEKLGQTYPAIKIKLLEGLALSLCQRLRRVTRELAAINE
jgi:glutaminase